MTKDGSDSMRRTFAGRRERRGSAPTTAIISCGSRRVSRGFLLAGD
jgi:hypothetical protein